jgi:hypothetical protein
MKLKLQVFEEVDKSDSHTVNLAELVQRKQQAVQALKSSM